MKRDATIRLPALRLDDQRDGYETVESVAEETPVALVYNGTPHVVMMATPHDLRDFAIGFSVCEGIVEKADELELVDQLETEHGISLEMLVPQGRHDELLRRQRNLTGRTGCGLCGASTLADAIRPVRKVNGANQFDPGAVREAFARLEAAQSLNRCCGGLHAAALLLNSNGLLIREDVGRHNAIDKVFGAASATGEVPRALLVTSRASYEVVHKAAQMECSVVAAMSAPTALAIRLAQEAGITLIAFARRDRMTVYAGGRSKIHEIGRRDHSDEKQQPPCEEEHQP